MTDENNERAEHAGDPRVSRRYRELGAEEPPRALDDAILAAARREAGARPATLTHRAGRQRWYAPLATAAVLVLAVAVTLNMQVERPEIESPVQQAAPPPAAEPSSPVAEAQLKPKAEVHLRSAPREAAKQPAPSLAAAPTTPAASEPKPFAADQVVATTRSDDSRGAASSATGTLGRQVEERTSRDAEAAARGPQVGPVQALAKRAERAERAGAPANLQAQKQADTPERELERIAQLRRDGKHDEADKALAEFRKRHPGYTVSEAMRERVERR